MRQDTIYQKGLGVLRCHLLGNQQCWLADFLLRCSTVYLCFFKQLCNLINFLQIPVSVVLILFSWKWKNFRQRDRMTDDEEAKINCSYNLRPLVWTLSINITQLALRFEWVPWCLCQSVLKVSGNREKWAIMGDVGQPKKENVICTICSLCFYEALSSS